MAKRRRRPRNTSKPGTNRNVPKSGAGSIKRIDPIADATKALEAAKKTANRAATQRPARGKLSRAAEKARLDRTPKTVVEYRPEPKQPFKAAPAYTPKKGGLASRAMPTGPRQSTRALQSAKKAWAEPQTVKGPKTRKTPAELAAFNRKRRVKRNSLKPWEPCQKRPDEKKAAKMRVSGKGKGGYEFRKWC